MTKEIAKDIAIALIAKTGYCFDGQAFAESSLSEEDQEKILYDIQTYCEKVFDKIEKKYGIELKNTTHEVANDIINASKDKRSNGINFSYIVVDDPLETCFDSKKVEENYNKFLEMKLPINSHGVVSSSPIRIHESKIKK